MEIKNNGIPSPVVPTTPVQQAPDTTSAAPRPRIAAPTGSGPRPTGRDIDAEEIERLARRYGREAQLALEGLLYWSLRWPFELMATLVASGRKWEEEYNRPAPKRRVSLYDEEG